MHHLITQSTDDNTEDNRSNRFSPMANKLSYSRKHSECVQNILQYVSGFIVAKLAKKVKCGSRHF